MGRLLVMGGNEDPDEDRMRLIPRLVEIAGGIESRIMLCSAPAEDQDQKIRAYEPLFRRLGCEEVIPAKIRSRNEADETALLDAVERATAVFFTGGDQLRLTALFAGTQLANRMHDRLFGDGLVVAGTSAGAAALSSIMVIGGPEAGTVRRGDVDLAPGLGFWRDTVIDTHFNERGRVHRLLAVFAQNPQILGIGVDEDTALDVIPGDRLWVVGAGSVMVFNGRVSFSSAPDTPVDHTITLTDATVHVLADGYGYDLRRQRPLRPDGREIPRPS